MSVWHVASPAARPAACLVHAVGRTMDRRRTSVTYINGDAMFRCLRVAIVSGRVRTFKAGIHLGPALQARLSSRGRTSGRDDKAKKGRGCCHGLVKVSLNILQPTLSLLLAAQFPANSEMFFFLCVFSVEKKNCVNSKTSANFRTVPNSVACIHFWVVQLQAMRDRVTDVRKYP